MNDHQSWRASEPPSTELGIQAKQDEWSPKLESQGWISTKSGRLSPLMVKAHDTVSGADWLTWFLQAISFGSSSFR